MKIVAGGDSLGKLMSWLKKYKFVVLVVLVGVILMLIPTGSGSSSDGTEVTVEQDSVVFSLAETESRIAAALSEIDGAGSVTVVLTLETGTEQVLATDKELTVNGEDNIKSSEKTVTVSEGSGYQSPVTTKYLYPEFRGALVVSEGADSASVRLAITQAVSALTGLGADKITVAKKTAG